MRKIGVYFIFFAALLAFVSACNPFSGAIVPTVPPPTFQPPQSSTVVIVPTVAPTLEAFDTGIVPDVDFAGVSFILPISVTTEVADSAIVPAIAPTEDTPFWEVVPELVQFTLSGNEAVTTRQVAQIRVYPIADFGVQPEYAQVFTDLYDLLQTRPEYIYNNVPYLPLTSNTQIIKSHIHYFDFQNGQGVRFITQQGPFASLITNQDLIYTFQGLTDDNQFYISASIPINHAILPPNDLVTPRNQEEFLANFGNYLGSTQNQLSSQSVNSFTPRLSDLDELFSSVSITIAP